jgi:hypothetical protein
MKKLNLLFQISTLTSILVAGFFTLAVAQNADEQAKDQKLTIDIEVTENGELGKREKSSCTKIIHFDSKHDTQFWNSENNTVAVKEITVVIELQDATKEDEEMLAQPAAVNFKKELALNRIEFSPNPSNGQFNLAFELPEKKATRVLVLDQMGRKVNEEILGNFSGTYKNQIDISSRPNGVYFLIIAQGEKQFTRKIVKQ